MQDAMIAVNKKIDAYMNNYILDKFDPNKIYWWFSLSGGKDSFIMSYVINKWYEINGYDFHGEGFCFLQWNFPNEQYELLNHIDWMPVKKIDIHEATLLAMNHHIGDQANCAMCSSIRKREGDSYIKANLKKEYTNILTRGLHLTDTAISYLWRDFWRIDTHQFALDLNKCNPLTIIDLENKIYLSKPLCYVREFEIQCLANELNLNSVSLNCPLCKYPSRRDIVEETLRQLFNDDLWEFQVNGINTYVNKISKGSNFIELSLGGKEIKKSCLPDEFFDYAFLFWRKRFDYNITSKILFNEKAKTLDKSGIDYLIKHKTETSKNLLMPKVLLDEPFSIVEMKMIATAGPFWGAISYEDASTRNYLLELQRNMFGIEIQKTWSQVIILLKKYYKEVYGEL